MKSPLNLLVVDGKKVIKTATLPIRMDGQPVHITAIDGGKYLLSSGENQAAPDHVIVKRVGNDLQMFTQDGDNTPELIIDGFYQHQGELSGLAPDGSYHVYVNQEGSDRDAFLLLDDNGSSTLILSDATHGLEGLVVSDALSNAALGLAALAALAGIGIALLHHHHHDSDNTPPVPAPGIAHDRVGTIQGIIPQQGLTNDNHPLLTGVAARNSVLRVYADGKLIGSTLVGPDGKWQLVPEAALADGSHDLTFSAAYGSRESAQSSPIHFTVDTTPPDAPLVNIVDGKDQDLSHGGLTNNGNMEMSGHDGVPGDVVKLYDGDTLVGSAVVGASGSWSVPVKLVGDGEHDLSASYTDPAGNEGTRSPLAPIELDTTPPDAPLISDLIDAKNQDLLANDLTNNGNLVVSGRGAVPGDLLKLYDGDTLVGSAIVAPNGSWTVPTNISGDGVHDLNATLTDPAGNESLRSAPAPVDLDTTPPDAPLISDLIDAKNQDLLANDLTNNGNLVVSGRGAVPGDLLKLYDGDTLVGSAIVAPNGSWTVPTNISGDGIHNLNASLTDPAGNESLRSAPAPVDLDTTPPDAPLISDLIDAKNQDSLANDLTNNGNLVVSGRGAVPGDLLKLYDGETLVGSAIVAPNGSWTVPTNISGDGVHNLNASLTDPAGNESLRSAPAPVDLDTTAPTTTLTLDDNAPSLSGVTEANALVFIYEGSTLLASQRADANGDWSWRPGGTLADGIYHYNATAQDALGNTSAHTANLDFRVATTVNDFNDTTGQGWNIVGAHAGDTTFTGSNVTLNPGGPMAAGDIITREVTVEAGHTYTFSFRAIMWLQFGMEPTSMTMGLKIDDVALPGMTPVYNNWGTYTWTATTSGVIKLAIFTDLTDYPAGNKALIDDFTIRDSAPVGATSVSSFEGQNHDDSNGHHDDSISSLSTLHDDSASTHSAPHDSGSNHFQLNGNELHLIDNSPVIELAHVAQQQQGQPIHSLSLEGHGNNVLNVNINDVLALGSEDLFQQDGNKQLMIKGDAGDTVNLKSLNGDKSPEQWNAQGQVSHDGTTYNVYQNVDHEVEVLIQQGVQVHQ